MAVFFVCMFSLEWMGQLATLVSLQYLTRVSGFDVLESYRLKCNLSFDIVLQMANSLQFQLKECLYDAQT